MTSLSLDRKSLQSRCRAAESRKLQWHTLLEDAYDYILPHRNTFERKAAGQQRNRHVFDSTATEAAREFASVLQSLLVPPWREWSQIEVGSAALLGVNEEQVLDINKQLSAITRVGFDFLNHSNFYQQATESFLDLSIGTGAIISQWREDPRVGGILNFKAIPLKELLLEEGPAGTIENVWRKMNVQMCNIKRLWPEFSFKDNELNDLQNDPMRKMELKEAVLFDASSGNYTQIVVDKNFNVRFEADQGASNPWIVFRWNVNPDEIYGRGPGIMNLPDIRTLNKIVEYVLRNAALSVNNIYTHSNGQEGAFNPFTVNLTPNMIIPVRSNDNRNPTLRALDRSGDLNFGDVLTQRLQQKIKQAFLNDVLDPGGPVRTATEVAIEDSRLSRRIGAEFGRLQSEFVEPLIARVMFLLQRENVIPPIKIDGRTITIKHTSPLARAQDQQDLIALQQTFESIQAIPPEIIAQSMKVEDIPAWVHEKAGGDPALLRTAEEKLELQQKLSTAIEDGAIAPDGGQAALPAPAPAQAA